MKKDRRKKPVTDDVFEEAMSGLQKILGEGYIEKVPGQGYRFAAPVEIVERPPYFDRVDDDSEEEPDSVP